MMMNDKNNVEDGNNDDNEDGVRGVFVNSDVNEGDAILKIPLSSCLRDNDGFDCKGRMNTASVMIRQSLLLFSAFRIGWLVWRLCCSA